MELLGEVDLVPERSAVRWCRRVVVAARGVVLDVCRAKELLGRPGFAQNRGTVGPLGHARLAGPVQWAPAVYGAIGRAPRERE